MPTVVNLVHIRNTIDFADMTRNVAYLNVRLFGHGPEHKTHFIGPFAPAMRLAFAQRVMTNKGPAAPRYWHCCISWRGACACASSNRSNVLSEISATDQIDSTGFHVDAAAPIRNWTSTAYRCVPRLMHPSKSSCLPASTIVPCDPTYKTQVVVEMAHRRR